MHQPLLCHVRRLYATCLCSAVTSSEPFTGHQCPTASRWLLATERPLSPPTLGHSQPKGGVLPWEFLLCHPNHDPRALGGGSLPSGAPLRQGWGHSLAPLLPPLSPFFLHEPRPSLSPSQALLRRDPGRLSFSPLCAHRHILLSHCLWGSTLFQGTCTFVGLFIVRLPRL